MKKRWKSASNEVNEPYFFSENATKNNKWFIIRNIPSLPDIFSIDHKTKQHVKISKLENLWPNFEDDRAQEWDTGASSHWTCSHCPQGWLSAPSESLRTHAKFDC